MSFLIGSQGVAETGVTDNEVVLGTTNSLSGPLIYAGTQTNIGINCYIKMVNERGGINGRKIKVISEDDQYDSGKAIVCLQHLIENGVFWRCRILRQRMHG